MNEREHCFYRSLYDVVKSVNSSLDTTEVLNNITKEVATAMQAKGATLRLLDKQGKRLLAGASFGLSKDYLRKGTVDLAKSRIDVDVLKGEPLYIENAAEDSRFQYPEAAKAENIHSVLIVPLVVDKKAIGVLRVYTGEKRSFDKDEVEFLTAIADVCAMAIENARLHQALKSDYELLAAFEYRIFED